MLISTHLDTKFKRTSGNPVSCEWGEAIYESHIVLCIHACLLEHTVHDRTCWLRPLLCGEAQFFSSDLAAYTCFPTHSRQSRKSVWCCHGVWCCIVTLHAWRALPCLCSSLESSMDWPRTRVIALILIHGISKITTPILTLDIIIAYLENSAPVALPTPAVLWIHSHGLKCTCSYS